MTALATTTPPADPLRQITTWILSGFSEPEIVEAAEHTWPSTKVRPLIVEALKRIEKQGEPNRQLVVGWAIEATRLCYQKSVEAGDIPTALRAIRQIVDLSK